MTTIYNIMAFVCLFLAILWVCIEGAASATFFVAYAILFELFIIESKLDKDE